MKRIYISDAVHEHLKREAKRDGRTLQWVVENKLTGETGVPQKITEAKTPKNNFEPTAKVDDLFAKPDADDILRSNTEKPCCSNDITPCKHWVWDINSGEGYTNTLSGRFKEVE